MEGKKTLENNETYLLVKVTIAPIMISEFNEFWAREILPFWVKNGARHIRSFVNQAGGPTNEILRLFEFDDVFSWGKFSTALAETEEGRTISRELRSKWDIVAEMRLLRPIL
jgi:hypothetical protein